MQIGKPAVQPLIDAHEHKNAALEADAKKYEFRPGVIEQKTALILGDLRAKEAVPMMLAELKKPLKGDNHTGALYALGMIADPATTKEIVGVLTDAKRDFKVRISAAEALNFAGDTSALPAILQVAKTGDVIKDKEKYPDVRLAAAMTYARLGGAAEAARSRRWRPARRRRSTSSSEDAERLEVAKKCGKDVTCYATALDTDPKLTHQEKAAFMLARMGKPALPALLKKLSTREPLVRQAVLFGIGKVGDKSSPEAHQGARRADRERQDQAARCGRSSRRCAQCAPRSLRSRNVSFPEVISFAVNSLTPENLALATALWFAFVGGLFLLRKIVPGPIHKGQLLRDGTQEVVQAQRVLHPALVLRVPRRRGRPRTCSRWRR